MTSVSSSMFTGLISTMSAYQLNRRRGQGKLTEALITDIKIPQVDPQIIGRDICLLIGIDRYRIDMICVSIGIYFSRNGSGD